MGYGVILPLARNAVSRRSLSRWKAVLKAAGGSLAVWPPTSSSAREGLSRFAVAFATASKSGQATAQEPSALLDLLPSPPRFVLSDNVPTAKSSADVHAKASEAVLDVLDTLHALLSKDARGLPQSKRSPDLIIVNTRSGERP